MAVTKFKTIANAIAKLTITDLTNIDVDDMVTLRKALLICEHQVQVEQKKQVTVAAANKAAADENAYTRWGTALTDHEFNLRRNSKIAAIKEVRERSNLTLSDAKELVESYDFYVAK